MRRLCSLTFSMLLIYVIQPIRMCILTIHFCVLLCPPTALGQWPEPAFLSVVALLCRC